MTFEQQKNSKALAWTAGVHILLLFLFLFFKYTMPVQLPTEDLGMEVNLGTSDQGSGNDQPEVPEDPAPAVTASLNNPAASASTATREVHTTEDIDAPVVPVNKNISRKQKETKPENKLTKHKNAVSPNSAVTKATTTPRSARYVYPGSTGTGGNSALNHRPGTSEGIGQGDGDMGVPGGTPGASAYTGVPGGGGTSIGHSISGRNMVSRPDPKAEFREGGKVVIRVTVNREGQITDSRVVSAANATIRALALKKIQSVRFNHSSTAPAEQFGNITFDFRTTRK